MKITTSGPGRRRLPARAASICGLFLAVSLWTGPSLIGRAAGAAETYRQAPGPFKVEVRLFDWTDTERGRDVPVKVYFPADAKTPTPLIVLSHGLGGSREGYEYLGRLFPNRWTPGTVFSPHADYR